MALLTSTSTVTGLLPGEFGALLIEPVQAAAVCLSPFLSTVITTGSHAFHVPVIIADVAAAFVTEGSEIGVSDPTISETVITPAKIGGLVIVSRELATIPRQPPRRSSATRWPAPSLSRSTPPISET